MNSLTGIFLFASLFSVASLASTQVQIEGEGVELSKSEIRIYYKSKAGCMSSEPISPHLPFPILVKKHYSEIIEKKNENIFEIAYKGKSSACAYRADIVRFTISERGAKDEYFMGIIDDTNSSNKFELVCNKSTRKCRPKGTITPPFSLYLNADLSRDITIDVEIESSETNQ